ncbi:MAG: glycosyltransferase family 4 protein [Phycisphaerales bacterium]|nr:glycosyltransferase family 4 protein [Phycisphaerales bacterium]
MQNDRLTIAETPAEEASAHSPARPAGTSHDAPRPRVLHITAVDLTIVALLWPQLRALRCAGYDVRCASTAGSNAAWLEQQGVRHFAVDLRRAITPIADVGALWRLVQSMRRETITIVHTHTPKAALLGVLAARLARVPVIVNTLHGFYFHDEMPRWTRRFYMALAWIGGRCAHLTLSQSAEDIHTAVRLGICRPDAIQLLGNGIDLERFDGGRFDESFRTRKRAEIGIPARTVVLGITARLVIDKGFRDLYEALRRLRAERADFHLVAIGPLDVRRAGHLAADAHREFGLTDCVTWLGPRDDVDELLACMDVFVLPSWREGVPRSVIEAAAMGLPIVATDIRGCREVVAHGENGLLVPTRDPAALAGAIGLLLDDGDLRRRMGNAGRERARREFDERVVCRRILDLYGEQLSRCRLPMPSPQAELEQTLPLRGSFAW